MTDDRPEAGAALRVEPARRWSGRRLRVIGRGLKLLAGAAIAAVLVAGTVHTVRAWLLPEAPEPFDAEAFRATTVPDDRNAYTLILEIKRSFDARKVTFGVSFELADGRVGDGQAGGAGLGRRQPTGSWNSGGRPPAGRMPWLSQAGSLPVAGGHLSAGGDLPPDDGRRPARGGPAGGGGRVRRRPGTGTTPALRADLLMAGAGPSWSGGRPASGSARRRPGPRSGPSRSRSTSRCSGEPWPTSRPRPPSCRTTPTP